ncbi:MAG: TetR/AcrR family transcriptional regulator [Aggregatilineales bacterium]
MTSKRDQIFDATRDLIFEQGLQDSSMSQIARRANVGMGTIYNYFDSKEELVFSLYSEIKTAMDASIMSGYDASQPVVKRFFHLLRHVVRFGIAHPREFRLTGQLSMVPYVQEQAGGKDYALVTAFDQLFKDAQEQHLIKEMSSNAIGLLILGAINALVEAHAMKQITLEEDLIDMIVTACWDAIKR